MNTLNTMLTIADALVELCDEMPLKKVAISDIVRKTDKNRKTFYYHFDNKGKLIEWIFRYDLGQNLKQHFPESVLVYQEESPDSAARFPYYIRQKTGVRSLNNSDFFQCFAQTLEGKRHFYTEAFADTDHSSLFNTLYDLYFGAFKSDIKVILSNRYLPEEEIDFLADFYTSAFLCYFIHKLERDAKMPLVPAAGPFANIIHDSMEDAIKESQLRRNL